MPQCRVADNPAGRNNLPTLLYDVWWFLRVVLQLFWYGCGLGTGPVRAPVEWRRWRQDAVPPVHSGLPDSLGLAVEVAGRLAIPGTPNEAGVLKDRRSAASIGSGGGFRLA